MCTVCGCGQASVQPSVKDPAASGQPGSGLSTEQAHDHGHSHDHDEGHSHGPDHGHDHGHPHAHHHDHDHHAHHHDHDGHSHSHPHDYGATDLGTHVPGVAPARLVRVERDILAANDARAAVNRAMLVARGVLALNLVSSPGAGKTTLLTRTLKDLTGAMPLAVIEGDQQTSLDADRIRATGVPALQINTGKGCHLDADMVGRALETLDLPPGAVLFIENVGNLVCPAAFDLGEAHKVVILSVTEGDDKPLKYPDMFAAADLMLVTKMDLLPHVSFDLDRCLDLARRVNPSLEVRQVSATRGQGMAAWYDWVLSRRSGGVHDADRERTAS